MADKQDPPSAVENFKSAIITAAAEAVVAQMTAEQMHEFAGEVLRLALEDLAKPYGKFHQVLSDQASKAALAYLQRPEVIQLMQQGVEMGVNQALDGLSAQIKGVVVDRSKDALIKALTAPDRRYV